MALVVVPSKPLARAKARLSGVLRPDERRLLCLAMLADVCSAAVGAGVGPVVVVASDTDAEAIARAVGAAVARDPTPAGGLIASLDAAVDFDPEGMLIVASDLPSVSAQEIAAICGGEGVRLAPDAAGTGTNALWRRPSDAIPLAFGESSAHRHAELAAERGVPFEIVESPGLAFDVDVPAHLEMAWDTPLGESTRAALSDLGLPARRFPG